MTKPFLAFLLLILFAACERSDDEGFIDPSPRIKTITSPSIDGTMITTTYAYDSLGRIDKVLGEANTTAKYRYFADSLIVVNHFKNDIMESVDSLWLNDQGLVASKKSLETTKDGIPVIRFTVRNTYEYNAEGYLVKWTPGDHVYEIENGNTVKEILYSGGSVYPWPGQDSTDVNIAIFTFVHEFIPNSINTIGNENQGMAFLGKQDNNLVSSWQTLPLRNPLGSQNISTCTYRFDKHQRVTRKTVITGTHQSSTLYSYY